MIERIDNVKAGCDQMSAGERVVVSCRNEPPSLYRRVMWSGMQAVRAAMWRYRLRKFGSGSEIAWPATVSGGSFIVVGPRVRIWHHARIEVIASGPARPVIEIGEGTVIQPYVHIGAAVSVTLGKGVLIASHVYITDHDHDFWNPDEPPITNGRLLVAPTRIGDFVWLAERVMVLKGVTIGNCSVVGAAAVVTKDIPPYSLAVGNPARVVKRYDREFNRWIRV